MMDRVPGSPLRLAVAALVLALLGGCATGSRPGAGPDVPRPPSAPDPRTSVLEGRIVYLPRIALSPRAVAKVWLQDMSEPGSPVPVILDEQVISPAGQVPIGFRLRYDPQSIRPERRYTLLVRIYEGDRVRFTNAQVYRVLTAGCTDGCEVLVDLMN